MSTYSIACRHINDDGTFEDFYIDYEYIITKVGVVFKETGNVAFPHKESAVNIPLSLFEKIMDDYNEFKSKKENML